MLTAVPSGRRVLPGILRLVDDDGSARQGRRVLPGIPRLVDDDGSPRLVDVVLEAKVCCAAMDQHPVVRRHLLKFVVRPSAGKD